MFCVQSGSLLHIYLLTINHNTSSERRVAAAIAVEAVAPKECAEYISINKFTSQRILLDQFCRLSHCVRPRRAQNNSVDDWCAQVKYNFREHDKRKTKNEIYNNKLCDFSVDHFDSLLFRRTLLASNIFYNWCNSSAIRIYSRWEHRNWFMKSKNIIKVYPIGGGHLRLCVVLVLMDFEF